MLYPFSSILVYSLFSTLPLLSLSTFHSLPIPRFFPRLFRLVKSLWLLLFFLTFACSAIVSYHLNWLSTMALFSLPCTMQASVVVHYPKNIDHQRREFKWEIGSYCGLDRWNRGSCRKFPSWMRKERPNVGPVLSSRILVPRFSTSRLSTQPCFNPHFLSRRYIFQSFDATLLSGTHADWGPP